MYKLLKKIWFSISLQQKLWTFASIVTLVLVVSALFNFKLVEFSIGGFGDILNDNARCGAFLEAMEAERDAFQSLVRENTKENAEAYEEAVKETKRSVSRLPYSYQTIGSRRYARTWSIKNAYETYEALRNQLISMDPSEPEYVQRLYWVYDMQEYLMLYGNRLIQETLNQGNVSYQKKAGRFSRLPYGLLAVSGLMLGVILWLTKVLSNTMVSPVLKLSESSARIELLWYTKVVTFRSDKLEENEQGELTMTKKYSEEFKKQMVQEYLKGTSYPKLSKEYHVAKSTLVGWVKKYSEECQFTKPQTSPSFSENAKEIHELQKRIHELEKENLFLKKAAAFFAKEID